MFRSATLVAASLTLAAGAGFLTSQAVGGSSVATRTVTVHIGTGATGPAGPPGPPGPAGPTGPTGATSCPAGFSFGVMVFDAPGGQETIATCLKD